MLKNNLSILIEVILKDMEIITRILIQPKNKKGNVLKESLLTPNKYIMINK